MESGKGTRYSFIIMMAGIIFAFCIVFWVLSAVFSTYIGGRGSLGDMLFFSIPTEHLRNRVFTMTLIIVMGLVASLVYNAYYSRDRRRIEQAMYVIEQRQGEVTSLLESTHNVLEEREFGKVARSLFDSCKNLIGATTGYLALLSENEQDEDVIFIDSGKFTCTVSSGQPFRVSGLRAITYKKMMPVYDNNFDQSQWMELLPAGHIPLQNVLLSPMVIDGKSLGIMGLANKQGGFNERDASLAGAFGELAALALKNYRSYKLLEQSEEKHRLLAENAGDIIYRMQVYPEQKFEYISPSSTAIVGYTPEEHYADAQLGVKIVHPDDRHLMGHFPARGEPNFPIQVRWRHKDGHYI